MTAAPFWRVLGIAPTADESVIRKAYAAKLKQTNPEDDPEGFKTVRAAYDAALQYARWNARAIAYEQARRNEHSDTDFEDDLAEGDERAFLPDTAPPRADGPPSFQDAARMRAQAEDARWLDPSVVAHGRHKAFHSLVRARMRLEEALTGGDDADILTTVLEAILTSPAMDEPDIRTRTQAWLIDLLRTTRPRSDVLADRVASFFGVDLSGPPLDDAAHVRLESGRAVEEHSAACNRLVSQLAAGAPPERLCATLEAVLQSDAMAQLDVYARTQTWLVYLLHDARPHSDVLVDRTIEFFKWRPGRERINEWDGPKAVLELRARIAHERERDAFLERVADPRHEFNPAWREMSSDARTRRKGLAQLLSLRWLNHAERFLAHVDAKMPSALEKLDGVRVAWWRKHVFHIGPWLFAARALILLVVCSLALSTVRIPPPERSRFQELRAAAYATPADRVAARQLCKLAAQKTPPLSGQVSTGLRADLLDSARHDCSYAHQLMPDSLLIRQYQAIIELKAGNISRAANYFDEILAVSPLDSAALFGKGLALRSRDASASEEADLDLVGKALRLDPDVETYFALFDVDASIDLTPALAAPLFASRPAPDFDTPPVMAGSSVAITPAQNNTLDAYRRLGLQPFVEGRVELECLVIPSGALAECRIVTERPANYGLGELAIALSPGVLYTPARLAGAPVDEFPARVPFTFEAANAREPVPPSLPPASPAQSAPTLSPKYEGDLPLADPAALDCHFSTGAPC